MVSPGAVTNAVVFLPQKLTIFFSHRPLQSSATEIFNFSRVSHPGWCLFFSDATGESRCLMKRLIRS